jgi:hypothetical protein
LINRIGKTRYERNNNACFPFGSFSVGTDDALNQSIADLILDPDVVHNRSDVKGLNRDIHSKARTHEVMKN